MQCLKYNSWLELPVTQVSCLGPGPDANTVVTLLDVISVYAACKAVIVNDCLLGDQGLLSIASLLQRGCGKWWTGPKLTLLEITFEKRPTKVSSGSQDCWVDCLVMTIMSVC